MEHSCAQCGIAVEDGTPFCPRCRAPQIRVVPNVGTLDLSVAAPEPYRPLVVPRSLRPNAIEWTLALRASLLALVLAALITAITFGSLAVGMVAAGVLSVFFYRRRRPQVHLTAGMGARIGAFSGLLGFAVLLAAVVLSVLVFNGGDRIHKAVLDQAQLMAERNPQAQPALEMLKTPDGFLTLATFGGIVLLFACLFCASLGGALTAYAAGRKNRP